MLLARLQQYVADQEESSKTSVQQLTLAYSLKVHQNTNWNPYDLVLS